MRDDNCIFCKLANGDIPTNSIYEDEDFNVILDMGPATTGHALILPKTHAANLFELPDDVASKVLVLAKKLGKQMVNNLDADGMNLVQNNGETAGQTVMHFHLHLIPRYKDDNQHILWDPRTKTPEELVDIKNKIIG